MPQAAAASRTPDVPTFDFDPFSRAFFDNPYPAHEAMREAGPVVWIPRYRLWAMARHDEVHGALNDWQTYCSSRGVGLSDFAKEKPWRPPSIILEADPPLHTRTRTVLARILSPGTMKKLRETFQQEAEKLVHLLVARGRFDAVKDLAEVYPLRVFPDALGVPREGRENLLPYGNMVFNAFGPRNDFFEKAMRDADRVRESIMKSCARESLRPDGLAGEIYAAVDKGELTADEAPLLVRSFLSAGVDTTVNGLGAAMDCLARFPDQWALLRDDPSLARNAFEETLRLESPVQTFFRTTTREVELGGVRIGEGEKVLLFLAAANRDPRRWQDPDEFDIKRRVAGHVALGSGIHGCVGQSVARLEGELVLTALAKRVDAIEIVGEPKRRYNNTLRGLSSLPVEVRAKRH
jgi:4-methoxybenzoate monooxygenase (O-demethylating)